MTGYQLGKLLKRSADQKAFDGVLNNYSRAVATNTGAGFDKPNSGGFFSNIYNRLVGRPVAAKVPPVSAPVQPPAAPRVGAPANPALRKQLMGSF